MNQKELNKILDKLASLGANKEEVALWRVLYATMPNEKKLALDKNLIAELKQLSSIQNKI